jgi:hypothetical protein
MPAPTSDPREQLCYVRVTLIEYEWRIHRVKRSGRSAYVFARKGKYRIVVRVSDHPPSLQRRQIDLSLHPDGDRLRDLIELLCRIELQLVAKTKKRPRDKGYQHGGIDRSRGRRIRRMHYGVAVVKQR